MKVEILVCDVCQAQGRSVTNYTVSRAGAKKDMDLCDRHAKPLEELLGDRKPITRTRGTRQKVTTLEEIEKKKNS